MSKIALLGANGFVGSRAVEKFYLEGRVDVRPIVRNYAGLARLARFPIDGAVADATDERALEKAFAGCEIVVHAAVGSSKMIETTPKPIYRAAQRAGVRRIVYVSTASVHGQTVEAGTSEETPLRLGHVMAYNNAKVRAERAFRQLREKGTVELVILRPSIVFGPRSFWIERFARSLLDGSAYVVDGGAGICNTVYVDNLLHAIELAWTRPGIDGEVFLVGEEERVTWADFYRPIAGALGVDFESVVSLPAPPLGPSLRERIAGSPYVRSAAQRLPRAAKERIKGLVYGQSPLTGSPWAVRRAPKLTATREMAMLHGNAYKFSFEKAKRGLGYEQVLSFDEGMRRSIGWLGFCGFPLVAEEAISPALATVS